MRAILANTATDDDRVTKLSTGALVALNELAVNDRSIFSAGLDFECDFVFILFAVIDAGI